MSVKQNPGAKYVVVTPSDSTLLNFRALWVGNQGDLAVEDLDGTSCVFTAAVGWMYIEGRRVKATGTTATGITAVTA